MLNLLAVNYCEWSLVSQKLVQSLLNRGWNSFQRLHIAVQAEETSFKHASVPYANLIKMKTHFQFILMNWNITSPKMARNNILEEYAMQEKYDPCYGSGNSFLKFVQCVSAEQNNNNNENSDSSYFY